MRRRLLTQEEIETIVRRDLVPVVKTIRPLTEEELLRFFSMEGFRVDLQYFINKKSVGWVEEEDIVSLIRNHKIINATLCEVFIIEERRFIRRGRVLKYNGTFSPAE